MVRTVSPKTTCTAARPIPAWPATGDFKLGTLLRWAEEQGAAGVATGHYARVSRDPATGHATLQRGVDAGKDQSYFLFALSQAQLSRTMFPLGEMHKSAVREKARQLNLPAAERPESQDICFGDYKALVARYAAPSELTGGDVVDGSGKVLGHHGGVHTVTVGQRRGLGISAADRSMSSTSTMLRSASWLAPRPILTCKGLIARSVNWLEAPGDAAIAAEVQIRYRAPAVACVIRPWPKVCEVRFESPLPAVTPGQAAVFYRGDQVLGGGWIGGRYDEIANAESAN